MEVIKRRILIIEDEAEVAQILAKFLRRENFEVDFAYTLKEGLEKVENDYPIILLDISLEKEVSFPILKKAKKVNPKNIVIMVTGRDSEENLKKCQEMGAEGFIPKPLMLDFLKKFILDKIKEVEERRRFE